MIRPITLICFAAACGSGLYLYHEKHQVHLLDQQIKATVQQTEQTRAQTRMLHAEWTLLNDPDRLRKLAAQFLPQLQPVSPSQYTDMADLNSRLPAVPPLPPPAPPGPPDETQGGVPVAQAAPPASPPTTIDEAVQTADAAEAPKTTPAKPVQAAPPSPKVAVLPPRQRPPAPHPVAAHPVVAQAHRPEVRTDSQIRDTAYDPRAVERARRQHEARIEAHQAYHPEPPPAYRRPMVAEAAPPRFPRSSPPPRPQGGSLLGMAQGRSAVPPPRPMPADGYANTRLFPGGN